MLKNDFQLKHLLVIEDLRGKRTILLESTTCSLGRDLTNSVVLHSKLASRQHAILLRVTSPETTTYLFRLIDGNLQGKRSTNGLTVNGKRCFSHDLKHGDVIVFGGDVKVRYYTSSNLADIELLAYCEAEDISGFLPGLNEPFPTLIDPQSKDENRSESALVRLASFPELLSNPIIELALEGTITYLNPAAVQQFRDIREAQLQHPILAGLLAIVQNGGEKFFSREVEYNQQIFEQSIHYIAESDLIRSYVVDITERKRTALALQQAHHELEVRVAQRTAELSKANEQLRSEIVERQRTEEALHSSLATNRALLNAMPDSMFRISKKGIFVNFKAAKNNYIPMLHSEFLGKHLYEVLPAEVAQPTINCVERALQTGEVQILECQLLVNKNLRDYELRIVMSAENEVMTIVRDITERKRAEAEIRNALEKEKELNELKSRFVTMASHEFRTPLAIILSSAELLEYCSQKLSDEKKLNHLQRIQTAVKQMTGLLNDVLLLGKAEAGKLEFKPISLELVQFCQDLVEEMKITTNSHKITFSCSQNICVNAYVDEKLLRVILSNLLSNAIKYSPSNSIVDINIDCQQEAAIFHIQDQGIGIPLAEQSQLFNSFYRASNVGSISGTGLGLAIVKRAVDLHNGKIIFKSDVGVGTTFIVTIPLNTQGEINEQNSCN